MGAGSGISGKRALSSLRVCSTVRNILPPQDGLILRPSHAVPDGRRAASEMSDNVQLFPWETRDGLWAESGLSFPGDACAGAAGAGAAGAGAGAGAACAAGAGAGAGRILASEGHQGWRWGRILASEGQQG